MESKTETETSKSMEKVVGVGWRSAAEPWTDNKKKGVFQRAVISLWRKLNVTL